MRKDCQMISFEKASKRVHKERYHKFLVENLSVQRQGTLLDEYVKKTEQNLTDNEMKLYWDHTNELKAKGYSPIEIYYDVTCMTRGQFFNMYHISWDTMIEKAFIYFAILRKYDWDSYENGLRLHPLSHLYTEQTNFVN